MGKREYNIEPFTEIVVGDPMYLVNMRTKKSTTKYIANFNKIPIGNRLCGAVITEEEEGIFTKTKLLIYSAINGQFGQDIIDIHKSGQCIPKLLEERRYLKNDTKVLCLKTEKDKCFLSLDTDGDCGNIYVYKNRLAYFIEIEIMDIDSLAAVCEDCINKIFTIREDM